MLRNLVTLMAILGTTYLVYHTLATRDGAKPTELTVHGIKLFMSAESVQRILGEPKRTSDGGYEYSHGAVYIAYTPRTDAISGTTGPGNVKLVHGTNVERGAELVATKAVPRANIISILGKPEEEASDHVIYEDVGSRLKISFDAEGPDGKLTYVDLSTR